MILIIVTDVIMNRMNKSLFCNITGTADDLLIEFSRRLFTNSDHLFACCMQCIMFFRISCLWKSFSDLPPPSEAAVWESPGLEKERCRCETSVARKQNMRHPHPFLGSCALSREISLHYVSYFRAPQYKRKDIASHYNGERGCRGLSCLAMLCTPIPLAMKFCTK